MKRVLCLMFFLFIFIGNVNAASIFRVDDLKEGTFIEYSSKLSLNDDYTNDYGTYKNSVTIIYLPDVNDKENFEKYSVLIIPLMGIKIKQAREISRACLKRIMGRCGSVLVSHNCVEAYR